MEPQVYLGNLSMDEREVECQIRGLNTKAKDARTILLAALEAEKSDKNLKPIHSHAKSQPQDEIRTLEERYKELVQIGQEKGANPAFEFVVTALAKATHYKGRVDRLINTVGEVGNLTNIASNMRRIFNWYVKLYNEGTQTHEYIQVQPTIDPPQVTFSSPTHKRPEETNVQDNIQVREDLQNFNDRGSPTPDGILRTQSQTVISEANDLRDSVKQFFDSIDGRKGGLGEKISVTPDLSFGHFKPNFSLGNNSSFTERPSQTEQVAAVTSKLSYPSRQFNFDHSYKIKQKWNLSFDGTHATNVHDFITRLQQMASDDGFPEQHLTRILHLFLSKRAEDWYWVYKIDHPDALWADMKHSMLSFFSPYDIEEETREQILHKFQHPKESFSDFVLGIQKLNSRLQVRFTEKELIHRLCKNMNAALKNVTLPYQSSVRTVEELRILCQRYENMWDQTGYDPRRFIDNSTRRRAVNELGTEMRNLGIHPTKTNNEVYKDNLKEELGQNKNEDYVAALHRNIRKETEGNNFLICWNCKNIGHAYQDCMQAFLEVFCFGCGAANVRKPSCQNCLLKAEKNMRGSVLDSRIPRSDPEKTPV